MQKYRNDKGSASASPLMLSLQFGASFVKAAVTCAVLEIISSFELSSETTSARYLKLVTVPSVLPFRLNLPLDTIGAVCYHFGLLSSDLHLIPFADFVESFN